MSFVAEYPRVHPCRPLMLSSHSVDAVYAHDVKEIREASCSDNADARCTCVSSSCQARTSAPWLTAMQLREICALMCQWLFARDVDALRCCCRQMLSVVPDIPMVVIFGGSASAATTATGSLRFAMPRTLSRPPRSSSLATDRAKRWMISASSFPSVESSLDGDPDESNSNNSKCSDGDFIASVEWSTLMATHHCVYCDFPFIASSSSSSSSSASSSYRMSCAASTDSPLLVNSSSICDDLVSPKRTRRVSTLVFAADWYPELPGGDSRTTHLALARQWLVRCAEAFADCRNIVHRRFHVVCRESTLTPRFVECRQQLIETLLCKPDAVLCHWYPMERQWLDNDTSHYITYVHIFHPKHLTHDLSMLRVLRLSKRGIDAIPWAKQSKEDSSASAMPPRQFLQHLEHLVLDHVQQTDAKSLASWALPFPPCLHLELHSCDVSAIASLGLDPRRLRALTLHDSSLPHDVPGILVSAYFDDAALLYDSDDQHDVMAHAQTPFCCLPLAKDGQLHGKSVSVSADDACEMTELHINCQQDSRFLSRYNVVVCLWQLRHLRNLHICGVQAHVLLSCAYHQTSMPSPQTITKKWSLRELVFSPGLVELPCSSSFYDNLHAVTMLPLASLIAVNEVQFWAEQQRWLALLSTTSVTGAVEIPVPATMPSAETALSPVCSASSIGLPEGHSVDTANAAGLLAYILSCQRNLRRLSLSIVLPSQQPCSSIIHVASMPHLLELELSIDCKSVTCLRIASASVPRLSKLSLQCTQGDGYVMFDGRFHSLNEVKLNGFGVFSRCCNTKRTPVCSSKARIARDFALVSVLEAPRLYLLEVYNGLESILYVENLALVNVHADNSRMAILPC